MDLLTCTIMTSNTVNNYANTQNGRLQSTIGYNSEDTRKSEAMNQKNKLKSLLWYDS